MKKWECIVCGLIYDEEEGWPDDGHPNVMGRPSYPIGESAKLVTHEHREKLGKRGKRDLPETPGGEMSIGWWVGQARRPRRRPASIYGSRGRGGGGLPYIYIYNILLVRNILF